MLNLAMNSLVQDRVTDALSESTEALEALVETSGSVEQSAARVLLASVYLRLGRNENAESLLKDLEASSSYIPDEAVAEAADAFDSFGSRTVAKRLLDRIGDGPAQTLADRRSIALSRARMAIRTRDIATASGQLDSYPSGLPTVVGAAVALAVAKAHLALIRGDRSAPGLLTAASQTAATQGAVALRRVSELLLACSRGPVEVAEAVTVIGHGTPWHLTFAAEDIVPFLEQLPSEALAAIHKAADLHPVRWRTALRQALDANESDVGSAQLLEEIGERIDIPRLRRVARVAKKRTDVAQLGRALARRLADRVYVEDQGRISVEIGSRAVLGSAVRRKVLAMLTYLISRPDLSATRDQVLDALWPELDPEIAVNSLNQTVYFLRRVLEEDYSDDTSPGYVHHDSDVLWLDPELVTSRSVECRRLIRALPARPNPDEVDRLTTLYRGRFALDFEYEEWAAAYRDTLHAAYLEIVERSVLDDFSSGHYDRGIRVARRALEVDPTAEQIEVCLLRLYRVTGAHAAAAEQYEHYAAMVREEIGVEPPPLEAL
jgi:DNA-binding SARP family transcriptional activator